MSDTPTRYTMTVFMEASTKAALQARADRAGRKVSHEAQALIDATLASGHLPVKQGPRSLVRVARQSLVLKIQTYRALVRMAAEHSVCPSEACRRILAAASVEEAMMPLVTIAPEVPVKTRTPKAKPPVSNVVPIGRPTAGMVEITNPVQLAFGQMLALKPKRTSAPAPVTPNVPTRAPTARAERLASNVVALAPSRPKVMPATGSVQLVEGDCRNTMRDMLNSGQAGRFDCVITDPPFGINVRVGAAHRPVANDNLPYIWWIRDAADLLKEGGGFLCFTRSDVAETFKMAIRCAGLTIKSEAIWDKMAHGMGDTRAQFGLGHEVMIWATKGQGYAFHDRRPPSIFRSRRPAGGANRFHPTEKPVDLMRQLIEFIVPPGGSILEPFAGSGSTLVAAQVLGRQAVGMELDADYCRIIRRRLSAAPTCPVQPATAKLRPKVKVKVAACKVRELSK